MQPSVRAGTTLFNIAGTKVGVSFVPQSASSMTNTQTSATVNATQQTPECTAANKGAPQEQSLFQVSKKKWWL